MPELPEVEVVRRGLHDWAVGWAVAHVEVHDGRVLKPHPGSAEDFVAQLTGTVLQQAVRRGKYLWMPLAHQASGQLGNGRSGSGRSGSGQSAPIPTALTIHLGMSGQVLVGPEVVAHDRATLTGHIADSAVPLKRHERVRIWLWDGRRLRVIHYVDQRMFGGLGVVAMQPTGDQRPGGCAEPLLADAWIPCSAAHIARDLLDPDFAPDAVNRLLRQRKTGIKRLLLDQTMLSGIGNIYADEALWQAEVHPERAAARLTRTQTAAILDAAADVMHRALAEGGTSFDALYLHVNGQSGYFSRSLQAYGRHGKPCTRCATELVRERYMNRSAHICPTCQRRPRGM